MVKRVSKRVSKQVSKRSRKRSRNRSKQRRSKRNSRRRVSKRRSRKHVSKRRSRKRVSKRRSRKRVKHMKGGAGGAGGADDFLETLTTAVRPDSGSGSAGAATIEGEGERKRIFNLISGAHPNFKEALVSEDTGVYDNEQLRKKYKEALNIYFPLYKNVEKKDANSEIIIQQLRIIYPHKFSHDDDDEVVRRQLRDMVAKLITKIERLERLEP